MDCREDGGTDLETRVLDFYTEHHLKLATPKHAKKLARKYANQEKHLWTHLRHKYHLEKMDDHPDDKVMLHLYQLEADDHEVEA